MANVATRHDITSPGSLANVATCRDVSSNFAYRGVLVGSGGRKIRREATKISFAAEIAQECGEKGKNHQKIFGRGPSFGGLNESIWRAPRPRRVHVPNTLANVAT